MSRTFRNYRITLNTHISWRGDACILDEIPPKQRRSAIRRHRARQGMFLIGGAPSWYCNQFERRDRRRAKVLARKLLLVRDVEAAEWAFPGPHRHGATWCWW